MTSKYNIRLLTKDDAPKAAKLWSLVFGDEEAVVLEFFRLFGDEQGFGACAEIDGTIAAAAYAPAGTDYIAPNGTAHEGVYLYAVATPPDHRERGLARKVCNLLKDTAWAQGKNYLFTRPSEESLYAWYEEKIGAVPLMGCQPLQFERAEEVSLPCRQLTAEKYLALRGETLAGLPHVRQSMQWMHWEHTLHTAYGGGFYAVGDSIADVYFDGSAVHVNELLPHPTAEEAETVCRALIGHLGAETCECLIHGDGHYVSVAARDGCELPRENGWFGPCYA